MKLAKKVAYVAFLLALSAVLLVIQSEVQQRLYDLVPRPLE